MFINVHLLVYHKSINKLWNIFLQLWHWPTLAYRDTQIVYLTARMRSMLLRRHQIGNSWVLLSIWCILFATVGLHWSFSGLIQYWDRKSHLRMHMRIYPSIKLFNFFCADDGTPPNFQKLWHDYAEDLERIRCVPSLGFVCLKWIRYFNNEGKDFRNNPLLHQTFSWY